MYRKRESGTSVVLHAQNNLSTFKMIGEMLPLAIQNLSPRGLMC